MIFFFLYHPYLYVYYKKRIIQFTQKIERASEHARNTCKETSINYVLPLSKIIEYYLVILNTYFNFGKLISSFEL